MALIELFSDHIRNHKSLVDYIEKRKGINERGEFNDAELLLASQKLEKLKKESPEIYNGMHEVLEEYYKRDEGHFVEYPINFLKQILMMYENHITIEHIYKSYKDGLNHHCRDAC